PFVLVFLAEIIMAWVLYGILVHLNMFTVRAGLISGALCWLGFVVPTIESNNAFSNRKAMLTVIDSVAWLGALLIIGAILGGFGRWPKKNRAQIRDPSRNLSDLFRIYF